MKVDCYRSAHKYYQTIASEGTLWEYSCTNSKHSKSLIRMGEISGSKGIKRAFLPYFLIICCQQLLNSARQYFIVQLLDNSARHRQ